MQKEILGRATNKKKKKKRNVVGKRCSFFFPRTLGVVCKKLQNLLKLKRGQHFFFGVGVGGLGLKHSNFATQPYDENLFFGPDATTTIAVEKWYSEKEIYHYKTNSWLKGLFFFFVMIVIHVLAMLSCFIECQVTCDLICKMVLIFQALKI